MNVTRLIILEGQNAILRAENKKLKAIIEYIGAMDYPEILEEVSDDDLRNGEEILSD